MEAADRTFIVGKPVQTNRYDALSQTVQEGYNYPVRDLVTGANVTVFVPADGHTVAGTDQLVEHALAPIRANLAANPSLEP